MSGPRPAPVTRDPGNEDASGATRLRALLPHARAVTGPPPAGRHAWARDALRAKKEAAGLAAIHTRDAV